MCNIILHPIQHNQLNDKSDEVRFKWLVSKQMYNNFPKTICVLKKLQ